MKKRILTLLLCLCMLVSLFPTGALAGSGDGYYLVLGDSISSGYAPSGTTITPFADQIDTAYELQNKAEEGETSASLLEKLGNENSDIRALLPYAKLITITIGGNDFMNALYEYLFEKYNAEHPDTPFEDIDALKTALLEGKDTSLLTFAAGILPGFVSESEKIAYDFSVNLKNIIDLIQQQNTSAEIIIANQYNPYSYLAKSYSSIQAISDISEQFDICVHALNSAISTVANLYSVSVANVYTAFENAVQANENPCNPSVDIDLSSTPPYSINLDFHPNQTGHNLIAEAINRLLTEDIPQLECNPSSLSFEAEEGYGSNTKVITLSNIGTTALTDISLSLASDEKYFEIAAMNGTSLTPGTSITVAISTVPGLPAGNYEDTLEISYEGLEFPIDVSISFTVNPSSGPVHTLLDSENELVNTYNNLADALKDAEEGYTVVMGKADELTSAIPVGVTLRISDKTALTVSEVNLVYLQNGTLEILKGGEFKLDGNTLIGSDDAIVNITSGSATMSGGTVTLTEGSEAEIPSGKTFRLMLGDGGSALDAVIESGASLTVAEGGTLKAVSGTPATGSKVTVKGTLNVYGTITVAQKASVEIADGGTLNLANLDAAAIAGTGAGTGIKGSFVFNSGANLKCNGTDLVGGTAEDIITLDNGKATLTFHVDTVKYASSYVDLKIDGDVTVIGNVNAHIAVEINWGPISTTANLPIHVTLSSGTTTIADEAVLNLMKCTTSGSQLNVGTEASLIVNGTLEIQESALFSGKASVAGSVYVFGSDGQNIDDAAELEVIGGAVYANYDISSNIVNGVKSEGNFYYTSIAPGTTDATQFDTVWNTDKLSIVVGGVTLTGSESSPVYAATSEDGKVSIVENSSGSNITWDGNTLTLNNAVIVDETGSGIVYGKPLYLHVTGTNSITGQIYCIDCKFVSITAEDDGQVELIGEEKCAVSGDLTIEPNGQQISVAANDIPSSNGAEQEYGSPFTTSKTFDNDVYKYYHLRFFSIDGLTIFPSIQAYDRNTYGSPYEDTEFSVKKNVPFDSTEGVTVKLNEETLTEGTDYTLRIVYTGAIFITFDQDFIFDLEAGQYTISFTNGDGTVDAKLIVPETYKITVDTYLNDSEDPSAGHCYFNYGYYGNSYYVSAGQSVQIEAGENIGCIFDHWEDAEGNTISDKYSFTYTPAADTELKLVFMASNYEATANPAELDFDSVYEGYSQIESKDITVANTGDTPVVIFPPETEDYVITMPDEEYEDIVLNAGDEITISIRPETGLGAGSYDTVLTFSVYDYRNTPGDDGPVALSLETLSFDYPEIPSVATFDVFANFTVLSIDDDDDDDDDEIGTIIRTCTLTFETNGGKELAKLTVPYGTTVDLNDYTTSLSGYRFAGWYSGEELGERIESIYMDKNKTVYSGWNPFDDIDKGDWFYDEVLYSYYNGLMNGVDYSTFAPMDDTTRAMLVTILWRLEGEPVVNYAMTFTDVEAGTWYTEAVRWAASEGIVNGISDTAFEPMRSITREEFATILWRYAAYKGCDMSIGENTNLLSYSDFDKLSEYAIPAMQWACGAGIIQGTGDGSILNPQGSAIRAEASTMLMRFCTILQGK